MIKYAAPGAITWRSEQRCVRTRPPSVEDCVTHALREELDGEIRDSKKLEVAKLAREYAKEGDWSAKDPLVAAAVCIYAACRQLSLFEVS